MTGGLLAFSLTLLEHFRGGSLGATSFGVVATCALLGGAYLAWRSERIALEEEQAKRGRPSVTAEFKWERGDYNLYLRNSSSEPAVDLSVKDIAVGDKVLRFAPPSALRQEDGAELIPAWMIYNGHHFSPGIYWIFEELQSKIGIPQYDLGIYFSSLDDRKAKRTWLFSAIFWFDPAQQRVIVQQQSIQRVI